jgi:predicted nucleotidyltransferase
VPVVSAEGLVMLKLFAWRDRHLTQPRKDAGDIAYVLLNYPELVGEPVLFEDHLSFVEAADYDLELAAARVLGGKIAGLSSSSTYGMLTVLLDQELAAEEDADLVRDLSAVLVPPNDGRALALIQSLHRGLEEAGGETSAEEPTVP